MSARRPLTDEEVRILVAASASRLFFNRAGRWEIEGEKKRPDRRSRANLAKRSFIATTGPYPDLRYRITAKGKAALKDAPTGEDPQADREKV